MQQRSGVSGAAGIDASPRRDSGIGGAPAGLDLPAGVGDWRAHPGRRMNLAFYAPMKPPDHPTQSGDRLIANLFLQALKRAGHQPAVVSRFRSYEGLGDAERQRRLRRIGERLADRLLRRYLRLHPKRRPDCWFTYHLYHKAPDWIGPPVSRALGIPYVVAEASIAPKQAEGPWREGFAAAVEAVAEASLVVTLGRHDAPCLQSVLPDPGRLVHLRPFLDLSMFNGADADPATRQELAVRLAAPAAVPWLITVAMMRPGKKLDSYRLLADALASLRQRPWHLLVVGHGSGQSAVRAAFAGDLARRVSFLGLRSREDVASLLGACDLFVWPAVGEALGMAMLEAQAAGVAVVAGDSGGVGEIVQHGETGLLTPPGNARAFAAAVSGLLSDTERRREMGAKARARAAAAHGIDAAAAALAEWLRPLAQDGPSK